VRIKIGWDWKQYNEIDAYLRQTRTNCKDISAAWGHVRFIVARAIERNFELEGRPFQWRALNPSYRAKKVREGYPDRILVRSGDMMRAVTVVGSKGNVHRQGRMTFEWGVDLSVIPYARIHDLGGVTGKGGRTRIPQREYLRLMEEDVTEIMTAIHNVVMGYPAEKKMAAEWRYV
jgi:phage gpG-like protein